MGGVVVGLGVAEAAAAVTFEGNDGAGTLEGVVRMVVLIYGGGVAAYLSSVEATASGGTVGV